MDADDFRYWYDYHFKAKIMGKCQQKNVWLFVHFVKMARLPPLVKTLSARILHNMLKEASKTLILLQLSSVWFYLC